MTTTSNPPLTAPKFPPLNEHYDAAAAAAKYYKFWEENGYFQGDPAKDGVAFSIVIPPPNVTGSLHMGHALNNTLQDILVRYHRLLGDNTVWIPGTDHASIALQWLIDKALVAEGTNRFEIGKAAFLARAEAFKDQSQQNITSQLRELGISCDWSRERFTLDEGLSAAVRAAFVQLYRDGLIYREETLVNWDPVTQTTLSDLEVIYEENVPGELWSFAYKIVKESLKTPLPHDAVKVDEIVVATTRVETMLGDTAIAVHPDDPRYQSLIGAKVQHPFQNRQIPIIQDALLVDPSFGSGAVKITPAHDHNDFAVAKRHNLPCINIFTKDAKINEQGGEFKGLDRFVAREQLKERLTALGLARGSTPHKLNLGRAERSGAIIEPRISTQWFVRAKPLATPALAAVENGFIKFVPEHWQNTYFAWLRNIHDWCISRQLWWGHQIPAWYCAQCGHLHVELSAPVNCTACGHSVLTPEEDVLDTWFSSALWPFSTLGWPAKTADLARWYPTHTLVTSFDIIFFWVARMIMMGHYFMGEIPFKYVHIHALIRDEHGEKMSKTKGNVIDPLVMIKKYGADAFRFTLAAFAAQGRDVQWDEKRLEGYQKFCNKIWQAFRFIYNHAQKLTTTHELDLNKLDLTLAPTVYEAWIISRLNVCISETHQALTDYRFSEAALSIYTFIWDELCDWYLEFAKITLYQENAAPQAQDFLRHTLLYIFEQVLRLLHPFMPFLSEDLWQKLRVFKGPNTEASIMSTRFPQPLTLEKQQKEHLTAAKFTQEIIKAIRRMRAEYGVPPKELVTIYYQTTTKTEAQYLQNSTEVLKVLAKATCLPLTSELPKQTATEICSKTTIFLPLVGLIDFANERLRLTKELDKVTKDLEILARQLDNPDFVSRAKKSIVSEKQALLLTNQEKATRLRLALSKLLDNP